MAGYRVPYQNMPGTDELNGYMPLPVPQVPQSGAPSASINTFQERFGGPPPARAPATSIKINGETVVESPYKDIQAGDVKVLYENEYLGAVQLDPENPAVEQDSKSYGATEPAHRHAPKNTMMAKAMTQLQEFQPTVLLASSFGSVLIFALASYIQFSRIRYGHAWLSFLILSVMFVACAAQLFYGGFDTKTPKGKLAAFTAFSNFIALLVGATLGAANYQWNFKTYYDFLNLAHYPSADPSVYRGQRYNDAGQVDFFYGSHLDISRSYGFKMGNIYCVAPIVGPETMNWTHPGGRMPKIGNYDYWAVGVDCCSSHTNDFHCGQYLNKQAHKGLRLMRDDLRDYFRLAVEGAKAEHNIQANTPLFFYLMESPQTEVETWKRDGWMEFLHSVLGYGSLTVGLTGAAVFVVITNTMQP